MTTFREQSETFLKISGTRRNRPVRPSTLAAYRSLLTALILPVIGDLPLADVDNDTVKPLIAKLASKEKANTTIIQVKMLIQGVMKSAVDSKGNQLYPRTWNNDFMEIPSAETTEDAPITTTQAISKAIRYGTRADKALYALLAGTALRLGEAMALHLGPDDGVNSFWVPETGTVIIRKTISRGILGPPKTKAGKRQVDLPASLNDYLCCCVLAHDLPSSGRLFSASKSTLYRHLQATGAGIQGFHSLRRRRATDLDAAGVPQGPMKFWMGHADKSVTERYIKSANEIKMRKEWAERVGLGFKLEYPC